METANELVYHDLELVTRAADRFEEPSTMMARDDLVANWNRGYGTAKGGDEV